MGIGTTARRRKRATNQRVRGAQTDGVERETIRLTPGVDRSSGRLLDAKVVNVVDVIGKTRGQKRDVTGASNRHRGCGGGSASRMRG
jgi:hypothetical protein